MSSTESTTPRVFSLEESTFTVEEVAAHLLVSRNQFYRLIADGKVKPSKIGARTIVLGGELRRFMKVLAGNAG